MPGARVAVALLPSTAPRASNRASRLRVEISGAQTSCANSLIDKAFFCDARCRKISNDSGHCSTGTLRLLCALECSVCVCMKHVSAHTRDFFKCTIFLVHCTNMVPKSGCAQHNRTKYACSPLHIYACSYQTYSNTAITFPVTTGPLSWHADCVLPTETNDGHR